MAGKVEDIDTPCIEVHEVKSLETKMCRGPDTLWFAKMLAQLVRKTPKGLEKKMWEKKTKQPRETKLWVHRVVNRMQRLLWFLPSGEEAVRGRERNGER